MVERVLIDTDRLIDFCRGKIELSPANAYFISEITVYEFIRGASDVKEAKKLLEESFAVIWVDNEILEKASLIWRDLRAKGRIIDDRDLIIGTTAIVKGLKLMTANFKHYERLREYGLSFYQR